MGSIEKDNANPTILSVSELPTHRQKRKNREASSKEHVVRDLLMAKPSYAMDPFYMSDFSDTDSDDSTVEPIDEQEIYGQFSKACFLLILVFKLLPCSVGGPVGEFLPGCKSHFHDPDVW
jgi:hypothetical protein